MSSAMVEALHALVEAESFSSDPEGLAGCAAVLEEQCRDLLGSAPERDGDHLVWRRPGAAPPVLVLCHYDTVWPPGTLETFPFTVDDGVARGPGAFDMKAGIVQGLFALQGTEGPVTLLLTGDEETGSPTSRALIEAEARRSRAVLVLEPATGRKVKVARKGVGSWRVEVTGRAAHPGLDPGAGANAAEELVRQVEAIRALARPDQGTTVQVTTLGGGTAPNVIPERAWCTVDVRAWTAEEAGRVEGGLRGLAPTTPGTSVEVTGGMNRGPLERSASEDLYRRLVSMGYDVGAAEVGGASDGNLTGALGIPTLDGLGAVGGGAHARDEHVLVDAMAPRSEMVARLVTDLLADG